MRGMIAGVVLLGGVVGAAPPEEMEVYSTGTNFDGLDEEIYPLGWAKDGERLALLRALPNEAADERLWKVQVIDLVEDKKVLDEEIRHLDEGGVRAFWAAHGEKVEALVKPHGVAAAEFEVRRFPALMGKFRGDSYEVSVSRKYGTEPNFEYRGITSLKVEMIDGAGKTKTLYEESWKEWFPMAAGVLGYVPNPQGDRVAILVGTTHRGWEAAPHIRKVIVVGARVGEKF